MANVKVAVRVRPLSKREEDAKAIVVVNEYQENVLGVSNPKMDGVEGSSDHRDRIKHFSFDYCYFSLDKSAPNYASQQTIFSDLGSEILDSSFDGYNVCLFAYGQTGSGKTYTMMGDGTDQGVIPRLCESLLERVSCYEEDVTFKVEVSFLEIYNERVRDLLAPPNKAKYTLKVREHPKDGPYVQDLSHHLVSDYEQVLSLMHDGNLQRTTAATHMHELSSRSHAIFTLTFIQAKMSHGMPSEIVSKINLVDLAGSERASINSSKDRLQEGANINKSLVTLGNCIQALGEEMLETAADSALTAASMESLSMSEDWDTLSGQRRRTNFVPYRNSILTWLLKDSLGGNSKTIMIATISPASIHYNETMSTLRYARRAKHIVNQPIINEDRNVRLIRELRAEIDRLRMLLNSASLASSQASLIQDQNICRMLQENEQRVDQLTEAWVEKWSNAARIMQECNVGIRKESVGVIVESELPHLIGMDDDLLSTGIILYHLKEGRTKIGRENTDNHQDIVLYGPDVQDEHAVIINTDGHVVLTPLRNSKCAVNGLNIHRPVELTQGAVILLGSTNMFRFNHPAEAVKLRERRASNIPGRGLRRALSAEFGKRINLSMSLDGSWSAEPEPNLKKTPMRSSFSDLSSDVSPIMMFNPGLELERRHKLEAEKLEDTMKQLAELEAKRAQAEAAQQEQETMMKRSLHDHQERIREQKELIERLRKEHREAMTNAQAELLAMKGKINSQKEMGKQKLEGELTQLKKEPSQHSELCMIPSVVTSVGNNSTDLHVSALDIGRKRVALMEMMQKQSQRKALAALERRQATLEVQERTAQLILKHEEQKLQDFETDPRLLEGEFGSEQSPEKELGERENGHTVDSSSENVSSELPASGRVSPVGNSDPETMHNNSHSPKNEAKYIQKQESRSHSNDQKKDQSTIKRISRKPDMRQARKVELGPTKAKSREDQIKRESQTASPSGSPSSSRSSSPTKSSRSSSPCKSSRSSSPTKSLSVRSESPTKSVRSESPNKSSRSSSPAGSSSSRKSRQNSGNVFSRLYPQQQIKFDYLRKKSPPRYEEHDPHRERRRDSPHLIRRELSPVEHNPIDLKGKIHHQDNKHARTSSVPSSNLPDRTRQNLHSRSRSASPSANKPLKQATRLKKLSSQSTKETEKAGGRAKAKSKEKAKATKMESQNDPAREKEKCQTETKKVDEATQKESNPSSSTKWKTSHLERPSSAKTLKTLSASPSRSRPLIHKPVDRSPSPRKKTEKISSHRKTLKRPYSTSRNGKADDGTSSLSPRRKFARSPVIKPKNWPSLENLPKSTARSEAFYVPLTSEQLRLELQKHANEQDTEHAVEGEDSETAGCEQHCSPSRRRSLGHRSEQMQTDPIQNNIRGENIGCQIGGTEKPDNIEDGYSSNESLIDSLEEDLRLGRDRTSEVGFDDGPRIVDMTSADEDEFWAIPVSSEDILTATSDEEEDDDEDDIALNLDVHDRKQSSDTLESVNSNDELQSDDACHGTMSDDGNQQSSMNGKQRSYDPEMVTCMRLLDENDRSLSNDSHDSQESHEVCDDAETDINFCAKKEIDEQLHLDMQLHGEVDQVSNETEIPEFDEDQNFPKEPDAEIQEYDRSGDDKNSDIDHKEQEVDRLQADESDDHVNDIHPTIDILGKDEMFQEPSHADQEGKDANVGKDGEEEAYTANNIKSKQEIPQPDSRDQINAEPLRDDIHSLRVLPDEEPKLEPLHSDFLFNKEENDISAENYCCEVDDQVLEWNEDKLSDESHLNQIAVASNKKSEAELHKDPLIDEVPSMPIVPDESPFSELCYSDLLLEKDLEKPRSKMGGLQEEQIKENPELDDNITEESHQSNGMTDKKSSEELQSKRIPLLTPESDEYLDSESSIDDLPDKEILGPRHSKIEPCEKGVKFHDTEINQTDMEQCKEIHMNYSKEHSPQLKNASGNHFLTDHPKENAPEQSAGDSQDYHYGNFNQIPSGDMSKIDSQTRSHTSCAVTNGKDVDETMENIHFFNNDHLEREGIEVEYPSDREAPSQPFPIDVVYNLLPQEPVCTDAQLSNDVFSDNSTPVFLQPVITDSETKELIDTDIEISKEDGKGKDVSEIIQFEILPVNTPIYGTNWKSDSFPQPQPYINEVNSMSNLPNESLPSEPSNSHVTHNKQIYNNANQPSPEEPFNKRTQSRKEFPADEYTPTLLCIDTGMNGPTNTDSKDLGDNEVDEDDHIQMNQLKMRNEYIHLDDLDKTQSLPDLPSSPVPLEHDVVTCDIDIEGTSQLLQNDIPCRKPSSDFELEEPGTVNTHSSRNSISPVTLQEEDAFDEEIGETKETKIDVDGHDLNSDFVVKNEEEEPKEHPHDLSFINASEDLHPAKLHVQGNLPAEDSPQREKPLEAIQWDVLVERQVNGQPSNTHGIMNKLDDFPVRMAGKDIPNFEENTRTHHHQMSDHVPVKSVLTLSRDHEPSPEDDIEEESENESISSINALPSEDYNHGKIMTDSDENAEDNSPDQCSREGISIGKYQMDNAPCTTKEPNDPVSLSVIPYEVPGVEYKVDITHEIPCASRIDVDSSISGSAVDDFPEDNGSEKQEVQIDAEFCIDVSSKGDKGHEEQDKVPTVTENGLPDKQLESERLELDVHTSTDHQDQDKVGDETSNDDPKNEVVPSIRIQSEENELPAVSCTVMANHLNQMQQPIVVDLSTVESEISDGDEVSSYGISDDQSESSESERVQPSKGPLLDTGFDSSKEIIHTELKGNGSYNVPATDRERSIQKESDNQEMAPEQKLVPSGDNEAKLLGPKEPEESKVATVKSLPYKYLDEQILLEVNSPVDTNEYVQSTEKMSDVIFDERIDSEKQSLNKSNEKEVKEVDQPPTQDCENCTFSTSTEQMKETVIESSVVSKRNINNEQLPSSQVDQLENSQGNVKPKIYTSNLNFRVSQASPVPFSDEEMESVESPTSSSTTAAEYHFNDEQTISDYLEDVNKVDEEEAATSNHACAFQNSEVNGDLTDDKNDNGPHDSSVESDTALGIQEEPTKVNCSSIHASLPPNVLKSLFNSDSVMKQNMTNSISDAFPDDSALYQSAVDSSLYQTAMESPSAFNKNEIIPSKKTWNTDQLLAHSTPSGTPIGSPVNKTPDDLDKQDICKSMSNQQVDILPEQRYKVQLGDSPTSIRPRKISIPPAHSQDAYVFSNVEDDTNKNEENPWSEQLTCFGDISIDSKSACSHCPEKNGQSMTNPFCSPLDMPEQSYILHTLETIQEEDSVAEESIADYSEAEDTCSTLHSHSPRESRGTSPSIELNFQPEDGIHDNIQELLPSSLHKDRNDLPSEVYLDDEIDVHSSKSHQTAHQDFVPEGEETSLIIESDNQKTSSTICVGDDEVDKILPVEGLAKSDDLPPTAPTNLKRPYYLKKDNSTWLSQDHQDSNVVKTTESIPENSSDNVDDKTKDTLPDSKTVESSSELPKSKPADKRNDVFSRLYPKNVPKFDFKRKGEASVIPKDRKSYGNISPKISRKNLKERTSFLSKDDTDEIHGEKLESPDIEGEKLHESSPVYIEKKKEGRHRIDGIKHEDKHEDNAPVIAYDRKHELERISDCELEVNTDDIVKSPLADIKREDNSIDNNSVIADVKENELEPINESELEENMDDIMTSPPADIKHEDNSADNDSVIADDKEHELEPINESQLEEKTDNIVKFPEDDSDLHEGEEDESKNITPSLLPEKSMDAHALHAVENLKPFLGKDFAMASAKLSMFKRMFGLSFESTDSSESSDSLKMYKDKGLVDRIVGEGVGYNPDAFIDSVTNSLSSSPDRPSEEEFRHQSCMESDVAVDGDSSVRDLRSQSTTASDLEPMSWGDDGMVNSNSALSLPDLEGDQILENVSGYSTNMQKMQLDPKIMTSSLEYPEEDIASDQSVLDQMKQKEDSNTKEHPLSFGVEIPNADEVLGIDLEGDTGPVETYKDMDHNHNLGSPEEQKNDGEIQESLENMRLITMVREVINLSKVYPEDNLTSSLQRLSEMYDQSENDENEINTDEKTSVALNVDVHCGAGENELPLNYFGVDDKPVNRHMDDDIIKPRQYVPEKVTVDRVLVPESCLPSLLQKTFNKVAMENENISNISPRGSDKSEEQVEHQLLQTPLHNAPPDYESSEEMSESELPEIYVREKIYEQCVPLSELTVPALLSMLSEPEYHQCDEQVSFIPKYKDSSAQTDQPVQFDFVGNSRKITKPTESTIDISAQSGKSIFDDQMRRKEPTSEVKTTTLDIPNVHVIDTFAKNPFNLPEHSLTAIICDLRDSDRLSPQQEFLNDNRMISSRSNYKDLSYQTDEEGHLNSLGNPHCLSEPNETVINSSTQTNDDGSDMQYGTDKFRREEDIASRGVPKYHVNEVYTKNPISLPDHSLAAMLHKLEDSERSISKESPLKESHRGDAFIPDQRKETEGAQKRNVSHCHTLKHLGTRAPYDISSNINMKKDQGINTEREMSAGVDVNTESLTQDNSLDRLSAQGVTFAGTSDGRVPDLQHNLEQQLSFKMKVHEEPVHIKIDDPYIEEPIKWTILPVDYNRQLHSSKTTHSVNNSMQSQPADTDNDLTPENVNSRLHPQKQYMSRSTSPQEFTNSMNSFKPITPSPRLVAASHIDSSQVEEMNQGSLRNAALNRIQSPKYDLSSNTLLSDAELIPHEANHTHKLQHGDRGIISSLNAPSLEAIDGTSPATDDELAQIFATAKDKPTMKHISINTSPSQRSVDASTTTENDQQPPIRTSVHTCTSPFKELDTPKHMILPHQRIFPETATITPIDEASSTWGTDVTTTSSYGQTSYFKQPESLISVQTSPIKELLITKGNAFQDSISIPESVVEDDQQPPLRRSVQTSPLKELFKPKDRILEHHSTSPDTMNPQPVGVRSKAGAHTPHSKQTSTRADVLTSPIKEVVITKDNIFPHISSSETVAKDNQQPPLRCSVQTSPFIELDISQDRILPHQVHHGCVDVRPKEGAHTSPPKQTTTRANMQTSPNIEIPFETSCEAKTARDTGLTYTLEAQTSPSKQPNSRTSVQIFPSKEMAYRPNHESSTASCTDVRSTLPGAQTLPFKQQLLRSTVQTSPIIEMDNPNNSSQSHHGSTPEEFSVAPVDKARSTVKSKPTNSSSLQRSTRDHAAENKTIATSPIIQPNLSFSLPLVAHLSPLDVKTSTPITCSVTEQESQTNISSKSNNQESQTDLSPSASLSPSSSEDGATGSWRRASEVLNELSEDMDEEDLDLFSVLMHKRRLSEETVDRVRGLAAKLRKSNQSNEQSLSIPENTSLDLPVITDDTEEVSSPQDSIPHMYGRNSNTPIKTHQEVADKNPYVSRSLLTLSPLPLSETGTQEFDPVDLQLDIPKSNNLSPPFGDHLESNNRSSEICKVEDDFMTLPGQNGSMSPPLISSLEHPNTTLISPRSGLPFDRKPTPPAKVQSERQISDRPGAHSTAPVCQIMGESSKNDLQISDSPAANSKVLVPQIMSERAQSDCHQKKPAPLLKIQTERQVNDRPPTQCTISVSHGVGESPQNDLQTKKSTPPSQIQTERQSSNRQITQSKASVSHSVGESPQNDHQGNDKPVILSKSPTCHRICESFPNNLPTSDKPATESKEPVCESSQDDWNFTKPTPSAKIQSERKLDDRPATNSDMPVHQNVSGRSQNYFETSNRPTTHTKAPACHSMLDNCSNDLQTSDKVATKSKEPLCQSIGKSFQNDWHSMPLQPTWYDPLNRNNNSSTDYSENEVANGELAVDILDDDIVEQDSYVSKHSPRATLSTFSDVSFDSELDFPVDESDKNIGHVTEKNDGEKNGGIHASLQSLDSDLLRDSAEPELLALLQDNDESNALASSLPTGLFQRNGFGTERDQVDMEDNQGEGADNMDEAESFRIRMPPISPAKLEWLLAESESEPDVRYMPLSKHPENDKIPLPGFKHSIEGPYVIEKQPSEALLQHLESKFHPHETEIETYPVKFALDYENETVPLSTPGVPLTRSRQLPVHANPMPGTPSQQSGVTAPTRQGNLERTGSSLGESSGIYSLASEIPNQHQIKTPSGSLDSLTNPSFTDEEKDIQQLQSEYERLLQGRNSSSLKPDDAPSSSNPPTRTSKSPDDKEKYSHSHRSSMINGYSSGDSATSSEVDGSVCSSVCSHISHSMDRRDVTIELLEAQVMHGIGETDALLKFLDDDLPLEQWTNRKSQVKLKFPEENKQTTAEKKETVLDPSTKRKSPVYQFRRNSSTALKTSPSGSHSSRSSPSPVTPPPPVQRVVTPLMRKSPREHSPSPQSHCKPSEHRKFLRHVRENIVKATSNPTTPTPPSPSPTSQMYSLYETHAPSEKLRKSSSFKSEKDDMELFLNELREARKMSQSEIAMAEMELYPSRRRYSAEEDSVFPDSTPCTEDAGSHHQGSVANEDGTSSTKQRSQRSDEELIDREIASMRAAAAVIHPSTSNPLETSPCKEGAERSEDELAEGSPSKPYFYELYDLPSRHRSKDIVQNRPKSQFGYSLYKDPQNSQIALPKTYPPSTSSLQESGTKTKMTPQQPNGKTQLQQYTPLNSTGSSNRVLAPPTRRSTPQPNGVYLSVPHHRSGDSPTQGDHMRKYRGSPGSQVKISPVKSSLRNRRHPSMKPFQELPTVRESKLVWSRPECHLVAETALQTLVSEMAPCQSFDPSKPQQPEEEGGWRYEGREQDVLLLCKTHRSETHSATASPINSYAGIGIIKAPARTVFNYIKNPTNRQLYDPMLKEVKIKKDFGDDLQVVYMVFKTDDCLLQHPRDCLCVIKTFEMGDSFLVVAASIKHPRIPPKKKTTRADVLLAGCSIQPLQSDTMEHCRITHISKVNLNGDLHPKLVNALSSRLPLCIANLRNVVQIGDV